jgi:FixJ family two-component response regulator
VEVCDQAAGFRQERRCQEIGCEFLTKPFRDQDLIEAVEAGLARDRVRRESDQALDTLRARFDTLSSREREVCLE